VSAHAERAASEARSEPEASGVTKEDSSSRASRGDEARSEPKPSEASEVTEKNAGAQRPPTLRAP
jgi:hypothetical protein